MTYDRPTADAAAVLAAYYAAERDVLGAYAHAVTLAERAAVDAHAVLARYGDDDDAADPLGDVAATLRDVVRDRYGADPRRPLADVGDALAGVVRGVVLAGVRLAYVAPLGVDPHAALAAGRRYLAADAVAVAYAADAYGDLAAAALAVDVDAYAADRDDPPAGDARTALGVVAAVAYDAAAALAATADALAAAVLAARPPYGDDDDPQALAAYAAAVDAIDDVRRRLGAAHR